MIRLHDWLRRLLTSAPRRHATILRFGSLFHMLRCLVTILVLCGLCLPAAAARPLDWILQDLGRQGYTGVVVEHTLLGRTRVLATGDAATRKIILNPRSGEIQRDLWTPADLSRADAEGRSPVNDAAPDKDTGDGDAPDADPDHDDPDHPDKDSDGDGADADSDRDREDGDAMTTDPAACLS